METRNIIVIARFGGRFRGSQKIGRGLAVIAGIAVYRLAYVAGHSGRFAASS
jgi:hypothetical protein